MNEPRTVINLEETIGKQVGRRRPPADPLKVAGGLNQTVGELLTAAGHKMPRRGVYRFHTHEEADQWMMMSRKKS